MILYYNGYVVEGTVAEIEQFIRNNTPTYVSSGTSGTGVNPTFSSGINDEDRKIIETYKQGRTPESILKNTSKNGKCELR